eukprot:606801-Pelagomonas_calceolata.AAC.5
MLVELVSSQANEVAHVCGNEFELRTKCGHYVLRWEAEEIDKREAYICRCYAQAQHRCIAGAPLGT